ncbi:MAG: hypothetical protein JKY37_27130 [Nannocystaceae bacterium]|nr:hypothetical protein [Nannocystaceae bacterium]
MVADFEERIAETRRELLGGNPQRAYSTLRSLMSDPALAQQRDALVIALGALAEIAAEIADPQFATLIQLTAASPDDPEQLAALGYECLEQQLREPAVCVLRRAFALAPTSAATLAELVTALETEGRHAEACRHLGEATALVREHFELGYLLAFNTLMSGDVAGSVRYAADLPDPDGEEQAAMHARVTAMLARAKAAAPISTLGDRDLRGWHFVASGGLLLHLSPFGFGEGMNGRYGMTQDSVARCRQGLVRLHAVLDDWEQAPQRILLLPDRDSHVLGLAAAALYGVPAQAFSDDTPGVIIAYDLSTLDRSTPAAVARHHPEQILFAHATCWTNPPPCVPDVTTYLYEMNVAPGRDLEAPEETEPAPFDAEDPTIELAVQAILDAIVDDDPDEIPGDSVTDIVTFAETVKPLTAAAMSDGLRAPMWDGGPVPSNRFG